MTTQGNTPVTLRHYEKAVTLENNRLGIWNYNTNAETDQWELQLHDIYLDSDTEILLQKNVDGVVVKTDEKSVMVFAPPQQCYFLNDQLTPIASITDKQTLYEALLAERV